MQSKDPQPYNSFGNGAAMRSARSDGRLPLLRKFCRKRKPAPCTHNHPEGIKGAQAVALAVFRARSGSRKEDIRNEITERFGYDLSFCLDEIRPTYHFDETCQRTVPPAIIAFWESTDSRMPSEKQSLWAAMPIRWLQSLVPLQKDFTAVFRRNDDGNTKKGSDRVMECCGAF